MFPLMGPITPFLTDVKSADGENRTPCHTCRSPRRCSSSLSQVSTLCISLVSFSSLAVTTVLDEIGVNATDLNVTYRAQTHVESAFLQVTLRVHKPVHPPGVQTAINDYLDALKRLRSVLEQSNLF